MRKLANLAAAAVLALSGCAAMQRPAPQPGDTREAVIGRLGQPTSVYESPAGTILEYATGPFGQYTFMARLGPDGRLQRYHQVLTGEQFATLAIGKATKQDVLHAVGRPAERSYLRLSDLEVWSYRYKESGVWNSMMHVHFDRGGKLAKMQNGPDPMFEEKRFFRD